MPRAPAWSVDLVLAVVFVVSGLSTTTTTSGLYEPRDGRALALILIGTVPYVVRRKAPLVVFSCSAVAIAILFALGYDGGSLPTVIAVGIYTVGAYRPLHEVLLGAAILNAALVAMTLSEPPGFGGADLLMSVVGFGAATLLGWTMQSRRLRLEALEREEGEAARRAAADERLRIAQELHDVVAHSLGVIAVQAGVGMHVIDRDPAEARRALEHISATSRASLAEIRRLLGMVRSGDGLALEPAPRLADLDRLAHELGAAGLAVSLDVDIDVLTDVPPGVELAAYRIVQESLTNAVRHAVAQHAHRAGVHRCRLPSRDRHRRWAWPPGPAALRRPRPRRHAGTCRRLRRRPRGGAARHRRVPGRRHPPLRRRAGDVIRVAVADDQALVRSGFAVLLRSDPDIEVVGEAADGEAAVEVVGRERPDVVLMDIRMPGIDGLEATRRITADDRLAATKVLILTTFDADEYVYEAIRAGASGFLLKDTLPDDLLSAVRVIAEGQALLAPSVTRRLLEQFAQRTERRAEAPAWLANVTSRELEVLVAVARGLSNTQIAESLFLSMATVKTHVGRLLAKLQARDRAQLVMFAYEAGIVVPGRSEPA